ncbi:unnamed protein product [Ostreobium quekettii]|uniref:Nucleoside phosphatase family-domain-containing protein n=1 Tax=Ostreobium quekettii TaxID=121088 RepID=A0A8S1IL44_9CHLO|nr:unnamed protein product [Ostreobium quekettii]|eukprot:evm.model.scf_7.14 EVM.evm.TU.scf_7.14   scf_7:118631-128109(+)
MPRGPARSSAARDQETRPAWAHEWWPLCSCGATSACLAAEALALIIFIVAFYETAGQSVAHNTSYVLVVDAGSTGTRMYVYKWTTSPSGPNLPSIEQIPPSAAPDKIPFRAGKRAYKRVETLPGMDHYVGDFDGLRQHALAPLLSWAEAVVPSAQRSSSPLFLFGTAGSRGLSMEGRLELLREVQAILGSSAFWFKPEWVKIISGSEEGTYGWVALNYLNHYLRPPLRPAPQAAPSSALSHPEPLPTLAALDLGGSSLEVTFEVPSSAGPEGVVPPMVLAGNSYFLKTEVYHHYGLNDAFDASVTWLLRRSHHREELKAKKKFVPQVRHPCMQRNSIHTYPRSNPKESDLVPENVVLWGFPDWEECKHVVQEMFNPADGCSGEECTKRGTNHLAGHVAALNGFHVVWKFYNLTATDSFLELEKAGQSFCARPWQEVEQDLGDVVELSRYCFRASYLLVLLRDILGIQPGQMRVESDEVAWPLGAALVHAYDLQNERPPTTASSHPLVTPPPPPASSAWKWTALLLLCILASALAAAACRWCPVGRVRWWLRLGAKRPSEEGESLIKVNQSSEGLAVVDRLLSQLGRRNDAWAGSPRPVHQAEGIRVQVDVGVGPYGATGDIKRRPQPFAQGQAPRG